VDDFARRVFAKRAHEMIVQQHPSLDDPQFSQRQIDTMGEALHELEQQADQENQIAGNDSVPQIGEHRKRLEDLAEAAGLSLPTIKRIERSLARSLALAPLPRQSRGLLRRPGSSSLAIEVKVY
jgi:mevalonate kinase